jgi:hypothetical protein
MTMGFCIQHFLEESTSTVLTHNHENSIAATAACSWNHQSVYRSECRASMHIRYSTEFIIGIRRPRTRCGYCAKEEKEEGIRHQSKFVRSKVFQ